MIKGKTQIQSECIKIIAPLYRCGVGITMGVGKTLIGLRHMMMNYMEDSMFLVVAPKKSIFQSWKDDATKFGLDFLLPHITFSTYLSLTKQDLDYAVVYLDECHSLKNSHDSWLSEYKGKILGLTGTPPRYHKSEKGKLVAKYCPIVYKYVADEAIDDGILNRIRIVVHTLELDKVKNMIVKHGENEWLTSEHHSYNYWCRRIDDASSPKETQISRIMRMKAVQEFPSKERYAKILFENTEVKTILFANTQEQADRISTHSVHSKNSDSEENLEKFKNGEISKLSCVLQLSEGVNIPDLRVGIIMHAYGNERKASQRIGRLMRLNPKDISLVHVLCYANTVDETWVKDALKGFDPERITWKTAKTP